MNRIIVSAFFAGLLAFVWLSFWLVEHWPFGPSSWSEMPNWMQVPYWLTMIVAAPLFAWCCARLVALLLKGRHRK